MGTLLASTAFQVNASEAARAEALERGLENLETLVNADVSGINNSLIRRVENIMRKIS
ncbi:MAG: hypothetical protein ACUVQ0_00355 [Thermoproteota archaeon]